MKILVVEDSPTMRRAIARAVEGEATVIEVADGIEALAAVELHGRSIDLIICNMHMPRMNGISLLQSLRSSPESRDIPFVVVTADLSDESIHQARREGASAVIGKPFRSDEMARLVRRFRPLPPQRGNGSPDGLNAGEP